jgi:hydroxymethylglutaryl-CoA reductase (NADPH)
MSLHKLTLIDRQKLVENKTNSDLKHIKANSFPVENVIGKNCEQVIGVTQVPLGIVGPLIIDSQKFGSLEKYIPLATTEGALVASIQRGCKATLKNGISTYSQIIGTSRGPQLTVKNIKQAQQIIKYLQDNFETIKTIVKNTEKHTDLISFTYQLYGKNLYLRFSFDTQEAMGMNMVTHATDKILQHLKNNFDFTYILSGNFCIDKKPAFSTFFLGRGKKLWAETVIKNQTVKEVLKTTPQNIIEIVNKKQHLGSIAAGSLAFNAHFVNIAAALFLATGQDLAHVVEASLGVTTANLQGDDLYFSIYLPSLMVGTVGGGTALPTQKEALQIIGIIEPFPGSSELLAEIFASAILAGELSLTAALASGSLVTAHQNLGRGKNASV